MVGTVKQATLLVGAAAATTFCTAVASVMGVVPRAGEPAGVRSAGADVATELAWMDREPEVLSDVAPLEVVPTEASVVPVATTQTTVAPPTTTTALPVVVEPALAAPAPEPLVAEPAPVAMSTPALPPRRVPSPAEVQQAIRGMERFVKFKSGLLGLLADVPSPTVEQVNELGGKVCTAFDEGQTFEQVKTAGLAMATDNPWVTISPAGAQYVVETAVALYCPGHGDKLA
jgi:hypothetical protein